MIITDLHIFKTGRLGLNCNYSGLHTCSKKHQSADRMSVQKEKNLVNKTTQMKKITNENGK